MKWNASEKIAQFNSIKKEFRQAHPNGFRKGELVKFLKTKEFLGNYQFVDTLIKHCVVEKDPFNKGMFRFHDAEPVNVNRLAFLHEQYRKNENARNKINKTKTEHRKKLFSTEETEGKPELLKQAIKLLKTNGYKILKPITDLYEEV